MDQNERRRRLIRALLDERAEYRSLSVPVGVAAQKRLLRALLNLRARPFLIKPNRYELELLSGESLDTLDKICAAARRLTDGGVRFVVVSMGGDGALMTDGEHFLHTAGLCVQVRSTVAAGDSMIAGLAAGFARSLSMTETFRLGVAAATARCMTPPEQLIRAEDCAALAAQVEVRTL